MINIFNLNKSRDENEIKRFTTYRKILEKCHKRIESNSKKKLNSLCICNTQNSLWITSV